MPAPDYLAVGHVTVDLFPDGSTRPGGTALYAATAAQRLGLRAAVVTAGKGAARALEPGVGVACAPSELDSTFENREGPSGRRQWVHRVAPRIGQGDVPPSFAGAPLVHLGPVIDELDLELALSFEGAKIVATPQGWMRSLPGPLPSPVEPRPFRPDPSLLSRLTALVLSVEDVTGEAASVEAWARACPMVALTRGKAGSTLLVGGEVIEVPAFPAIERDATGAGDVFAAALLIGLHEARGAPEAARFAARVAAASVEGPGVSAIPTRQSLG